MFLFVKYPKGTPRRGLHGSSTIFAAIKHHVYHLQGDPIPLESLELSLTPNMRRTYTHYENKRPKDTLRNQFENTENAEERRCHRNED